MDIAKPVIGQVHGYCLAGGSELAAVCDLLYVAEDAKIGYPVTRIMSPRTFKRFFKSCLRKGARCSTYIV